MNNDAFINDDALELVAKAGETTDDDASPNDDALLTALAVEQIATQKRDQTTTAQDVKRDVATRRETSKPNDENDSDVNSRQTSTSDRCDKRDSVSRWKTAALAWFGSFAIFCAVATLTFALTRDASPTQTAATQTVASTVPASDAPQTPPTPTQNAEPQTIAFEGSAFEAETPVNQTTQNEEPQAIAFEEPPFDDKTPQTPLNATVAEEPQVEQTTQNAEPQAIAFEEPPFDDQTPVAKEPQVDQTTQTLADAEFAPSEPTIYRKKISDVKIGERVVGVNPQGATPGEDDAIFERVKHCGYKLCYLKENGTTCEIELLRPVDWLDYERVQLRRKTDGKVLDELDFAVADMLSTSVAPPVATTNDVASPIIVDFTPAYDVEIWLELPEMGVLGWATLEEIDDEIAIQPGPGNVVTGTFAHVSDAVIDLQIEGQPKPIGCTTTHPFWSVDRQDFVEAGQLQQGERVQLYNGETKRVVQKLPRPGPVNVYNLEVYAEHVYRVTPDGVLTHNAGCGRSGQKQTFARVKLRKHVIAEINSKPIRLNDVDFITERRKDQKYDIGHLQGVEFRHLNQWFISLGFDSSNKEHRKLWRDFNNHPQLYEIQLRYYNRSHKGEEKNFVLINVTDSLRKTLGAKLVDEVIKRAPNEEIKLLLLSVSQF